MPERTNAGNFADERQELFWGNASARSNKGGHKYSGKPEMSLINDYERLLRALLSQNNEIAIEIKTLINSGNAPGRRESALDRLCHIWGQLLPGRRVLAKSGSIIVDNSASENQYNAATMSDGERAIFYNIGQCLLAPDQSLVVVDEPEIHIHKALMGPLWDAIEAERSDCSFLYLTHDLDFARQRPTADKYVIRRYSLGQWDIVPLLTSEEIPEDIAVRIAGSRKPVLFIEGRSTSIDQSIYGKLYPHLAVIPFGSCMEVIYAVQNYMRAPQLHYLKCYGIINLIIDQTTKGGS